MQSCVDGMGDDLSFWLLVCLQEKSQLQFVFCILKVESKHIVHVARVK